MINFLDHIFMRTYLQLVTEGNPSEQFSEIVTTGVYTQLEGTWGISGNSGNILETWDIKENNW